MGNQIVDGLGSLTYLGIDRLSNAANIIEVEHKKIHDGKGFTTSDNFVIANNETYSLLLQNPLGNFPHIRSYNVSATNNPMVIELLEGVTWSTSGNSATTFNNLRASSITPNLVVCGSTVLTDNGVKLEHSMITAGKDTGGNIKQIVTEWDLKSGSDYAIKITNNSGGAGSFVFNMFWYE